MQAPGELPPTNREAEHQGQEPPMGSEMSHVFFQ